MQTIKHRNDYGFFFNNLKQNIADRIKAAFFNNLKQNIADRIKAAFQREESDACIDSSEQ